MTETSLVKKKSSRKNQTLDVSRTSQSVSRVFHVTLLVLLGFLHLYHPNLWSSLLKRLSDQGTSSLSVSYSVDTNTITKTTSTVPQFKYHHQHYLDQTDPILDSPYNVSYDGRAFLINSKRVLLITGTIHYPRSTPVMWPYLLRKTKESGVNTIDTYVFWNLHEPLEGQYDFSTGIANLPLFLKLAGEYGLYVNLRIGPYVCAEWNFGGFPYWIMTKPNMTLRTFNAPFMKVMEGFVRKVLQIVDPFLATKGGPVIMLQMENEYGNVQGDFGDDGTKYINWAGRLAQQFDVGIPWIMCQQDDVDFVILTCNGFYCDNWIAEHSKKWPNQPPMFTELWTGWFQHWGSARPSRPAEDLAFSVARWVARGGTYFAYYMWHGGTNFGRWGSSYKTTSYDYDAPLTEYGYPAVPKYSHLTRLHRVLLSVENVLLNGEVSLIGNNVPHTEIHHYTPGSGTNDTKEVLFLSNWDEHHSARLSYEELAINVPPWTVMIAVKTSEDAPWVVVYSTSSVIPSVPVLSGPSLLIGQLESDMHGLSLLKSEEGKVSWYFENPGVWSNSSSVIYAHVPLEQLGVTLDKTDYLWYEVHGIRLLGDISTAGSVELRIEHAEDVLYFWWNDQYIGTMDAIADLDTQNQGSENGAAIRNKTISIPADAMSKPDKNSLHTLKILTAAAGLINYGIEMQNVAKGILGRVWVNDQDISSAGNVTWVHQPGLFGESVSLFDSHKTPEAKFWRTGLLRDVPRRKALVWYKILIPLKKITKAIRVILPPHRHSHESQHNPTSPTPFRRHDTHLLSFTLFTGTVGRGSIWINGNYVGRFWDAIEKDSNTYDKQNSPCERYCHWNGGFWPDKCLTGCGKPSQEFLHVPADWVLSSKMLNAFLEGIDFENDLDLTGPDIEIVVLEEKGGDPLGIELIPLFG